MTKHQSNVKTDYGALPASRDPAEIRKQVEFYFSDANLSYDDYMRKLTGGPANDPVPLATLHSFKRMRRFQPFGAVVAALRASATLAVVDAKGNPAPEPVDNEADEEVEGYGAAVHIVRRVAWAPPAAADDEGAAALEDPGLPRSVYAKGFGTETATTQFDVEAYFAPFGPVNMVRLRRKAGDRTFKGSAFVEFATEELARRFLDSKERPRWAGRRGAQGHGQAGVPREAGGGHQGGQDWRGQKVQVQDVRAEEGRRPVRGEEGRRQARRRTGRAPRRA